MKKYSLILAFIVLASAVLHVINIGYPDRTVFDEAYFATFASSNAMHRPILDIHPPLGKILYAVPLSFFSASSGDATFLRIMNDPSDTTKITHDLPRSAYGTFPYVPLRLLGAFFGLLLIVSVYAFLLAVTGNHAAALLAAFFLALDNAFLVETRLILMNGMYLAFGFIALTLFFKKRPHALLAGVVWGLALSVKLIAVVLVGPIVGILLYKKFVAREHSRLWKDARTFLISGLSVFGIIVFVVSNVVIPARDQVANFREIMNFTNRPAANAFENIPLIYPIAASFTNLEVMVSGNLSGAEGHPNESRWYTWPFIYKVMPYFSNEFWSGNTILLIGNPIVWGLGLAFVLAAVISLTRGLMIKKLDERVRPRLVLLAGYVVSLLTFEFIGRSTFLYHYFPALIFAICLAALFIAEYLQAQPKHVRIIGYAAVILLTVIGFAVISPYTYGFTV